MKQFSLAIFLLFSFSCFAQVSDKVFTTNVADVQLLVDNLLSTTLNKYTLKEDTATKRGIVKRYISADKKLNIYFARFMEGENYDLGKAGTETYMLSGIYGYYRDLFTFWKNNFQPNADLEKIATDGHGEVQQIISANGRLVLAFARNGKDWQILCNRYK